MTATCADGGAGGLGAKGLDISLAALQRHDPYIKSIVDVASQVALYTYNNRANEWEKTEVEGTLFIYTRLAPPTHGFTIMNRLSMENLTELISKDLDFQLQDPFLLYRNARLVIHGIWFYDKADCRRVAQRMKTLTQQEQAAGQDAWPPPDGSAGGVRGEGQAVDIIQMLTKAHSQYDKEKSTSEPKEIGGSGVLFGKPNLIKPIPFKPSSPDNEPKPLPLALLFGSRQQGSPKLDSAPPVTRKASRPPVARTLTYETPSAPAPAAQKLPQGQRAAPGGVLHTLSESPENRLCNNGVPLDHQHHRQLDPIKKLFQDQPPPHVAAPCCTPPHSHQHSFFSHSKQPTHTAAGLSPHMLVQKLHLVQQEQSRAAPEPPRPPLAPCFQGPAAPKAGLDFQAPSPQRMAATAAPTLLLSPGVFSQASPQDPSSGRALSKRRLQAALLHLIQTDDNFLDSIYEAYVGHFA
ncbi:mRNA-decapping enzyme 1B [Syngnathoides biaculeatus]|uniref:mRNA-decapping enzyme 1B n=1 Tax=Syngnathoides biaculeatus TaxID=300417 RepID=UPI002ADE5C48|nr:mRNA-decapping enzyme 1B [Syngnathoides biaculeatus]